ncbi:TetR/AcrR family transcriptional regulator [Rhodococcus sp. NPDC019627]|uniref:TetR/AcrR family transcriptional regulator n=1 Tax=unclassified Rhodococcus (in: high G+C Gram-positive bacteria) TaxID=192944 RepID=UPI0033CEF459
MARKRSLDEGPVLRGRILRCASVMFYERGYAGTSIRDIGEAVGISSSTMYHHFANKQAVLHAIITNFMTDFVAATVPVLHDRTRDPRQRLADVIRIHIEVSDERRPELLLGNPIRYALDPDQRTEGIVLQRRYHDALLELIEEGAESGCFSVRNPAITTMAILDMLNGVREWFDRAGTLDRDRLIDEYVDLSLKMLGAS